MYPRLIAEKTPDRTAYLMARSGHAVTYGELDARSNQAARLLREVGLREGDGIAFCLENHPRFFELCWAAQRSGLRYTAISSRLTPPEVEYILSDCGARVFITSARKRELAEALTESLAGLDARFMLDGTCEGFDSYEEATAAQSTEPVPDESEGSDMLYSSGTTGRPKGVKIPNLGQPIGTPTALVGLLQLVYGASGKDVYLSPEITIA